MSQCVYNGLPVSPEMPGHCNSCRLYLDTCIPIISDGYLTGAECDEDYCGYCPAYGDCALYFAEEENSPPAEAQIIEVKREMGVPA